MVWMILNDVDMEKGQLPLVIRSTFVHQKTICLFFKNLHSPHSPISRMAVRSPFIEFGCIQPSTDDHPQILTGGDPLSGEVISIARRRIDQKIVHLPKQVDQLLSSFLADPIEFTNGLSGRRRVIKTHLPLPFLPPQLLTTCKV